MDVPPVRSFHDSVDPETNFVSLEDRQCMTTGLEFFVMRNRCAIGQRGEGPPVTTCQTKTEGKFNFLPNRVRAYSLLIW